MKRQLLLAEFSAAPWAMHPDYLANFSSVLTRWASGAAASDEVMTAIQADKNVRSSRQKTGANVGGGIAVMPLYGVVTQRGNMVDEISGGGSVSTQKFSTALRAALANDEVGAIIIDLDSPGGSVAGTADLADEIFNARGTKPIIGFVNSLCASAAYWIASGCSEIYINQGGEVGSIGVYLAHTNCAGAMEKEGLQTEFVQAGKYKTETAPYGPLSSEARAFLQTRVDSYYSAFTSAVARGRGVSVGAVRGGMGQGRCLGPEDAIAANMVEGIRTMDQVVNRAAQLIQGRASSTPIRNGQRAALSLPNARANARSRELEIAGADNFPSTRCATDAAKVQAARRAREIELATLNP